MKPATRTHTPGPWTNDDGLVCGMESREQFRGPSIDIFDAALKRTAAPVDDGFPGGVT